MYVRSAARQPFSWSEHNCGLWAADWLAQRRGTYPASQLRGLFSTELGCARTLRRLGGLVAVVDSVAREAGVLRAHPPVRGDVVVARLGGREVVAIALGRGRVAARAARGVYVGPPDAVLAAWRV